MIPNQLFPLESNPQTGEPFLRLRRRKNIILTPMRWEDAPHFVPLFNDPRVYKWLISTPFPYALKDAQEWLQKAKPRLDAILQELIDTQGSEELKIVGGAPIGSIREIQQEGTDIYLGFLSIGRCLQPDLIDTGRIESENPNENVIPNDKLKVGDPDIVWGFGDYLAPSHHRQGIMTDAVDTLLHEWAIPRMNVRKMLVGLFIGNQGSVRVFEKNGFVMTRTVEEYSLVRGEMRGVHVLEWNLDNSGVDSA